MNIWYDGFAFCCRCRLKQAIVRIRCIECNQLVRHKSRHTIFKRESLRYGIAFIPTAIIVCSNLYNITFI